MDITSGFPRAEVNFVDSFKVQWVGKKMIVADSVEISDPWTPESCRAIKDDAKSASSLNWIKKVVS